MLKGCQLPRFRFVFHQGNVILPTLSTVCIPLTDKMTKRRTKGEEFTFSHLVVLNIQLTMSKHQQHNKVSIPVIPCGPIITKVFTMLIINVSSLNSEKSFNTCLFNTSFPSMQKLLYKAHCIILDTQSTMASNL